jgi:hypothetical protein
MASSELKILKVNPIRNTFLKVIYFKIYLRTGLRSLSFAVSVYQILQNRKSVLAKTRQTVFVFAEIYFRSVGAVCTYVNLKIYARLLFQNSL